MLEREENFARTMYISLVFLSFQDLLTVGASKEPVRCRFPAAVAVNDHTAIVQKK